MRHIKDHVKVILFDHDDTLVATYQAKWAEHTYIAKKHYNKVLTEEELREHWGKPLSTLIGILYGTDDLEMAMKHNKTYHKNFPKRLHEDTLSTLQYLHKAGKKLGVITAATRYSFNYDLASLEIPEELFDYTQTEDETIHHKPDPRVFEPALVWLKKQKIKPSEVVYIGDGPYDMAAAVGAGFGFIGITTGITNHQKFLDHGAENIISHLKELQS